MQKNRKYKQLSQFIAAVAIMLLMVVGFTSCDKSDTADDKIILKSFGPSPALRGGELRFIGNNMNQVIAVVIPGTAEITSITPVNDREIKIIIPQDAMPGKVVLKTPQGDITTMTMLTYEEPIIISSVTTGNLKVGDVLTIEGDYLNLIKEVIFFDGVVVPQTAFVSQTRKKLEVKVPAEAQTGKIRISNGAEIPIEVYSTTDVNIVLPTFTSFAPTTIKAGNNLTITGKDMNLIASIVFGGDKKMTTFTVNQSFTTITVAVPTDAKDGTIKLIAKSGVEIVNATPLTMLMPTELAVSPLTVKNGKTLTITGKDLDLVSEIKIGDLVAAITSKTATEIKLTVPDKATANKGVLTTLSTKSVETPAFDYVKPVIASFNPTTIMAGNDITITGTDLDLVREVKFNSVSENVKITPTSETSFMVTVPPTATTGKITLITVNGTQVESVDILTVTAADIPVITNMVSAIKPGQLLTINGTKLNLVESVIFADNVKATQYGTRSATLLEVYVPENAKKGAVTMKLVTFNGKEVLANISIQGTDPVVDPALMIFDFENGLANDGRWNGVGGEGNPTDAVSGKYYEITAANWNGGYWWFAENWMTHPSVTKSDHVLKMDVRLRVDIPATNAEIRMMLGGKVVNFMPYLLVGANWSTGGEWKTITIPLSAWGDLADPTPSKGGEWGIATWVSSSNFTGFCIDNIRYEKIK
jgi:hypothetical protein